MLLSNNILKPNQRKFLFNDRRIGVMTFTETALFLIMHEMKSDHSMCPLLNPPPPRLRLPGL